MPAPDRFRRIPSVTSLLARDEIRSLLAHHPRAVVLRAIRRLLDGDRGEAAGGGRGAPRGLRAGSRGGASGEEGSGRPREECTPRLTPPLPAAVSAGEGISL